MSIILIIFAALCLAIVNLMLRKGADIQEQSQLYLWVQQGVSFLFILCVNPLRVGSFSFSLDLLVIGLGAGVFLSLMMGSFFQAMKKGPPALSCAILNCASTVPALLMAIVFGSKYGYEIHAYNAIGILLVSVGLLWSGVSEANSDKSVAWFRAILATFIFQVAFLSVVKWQGLMMREELQTEWGLPFYFDELESLWFLPIVFLVSSVSQGAVYLGKQKEKTDKRLLYYATVGGIFNGLSYHLMVGAIRSARGIESMLILPILSVVVIVLCNLWGQKLYKERVNWRASFLSLIGLVVAMIH